MKHTILKIFTVIFLLAQIGCKKDEGVVKSDTLSAKVEQNTALPFAVTSKDDIIFDITITSDATIKSAVLSLDETSLQTAISSGDNNQINLQYTYEVNTQNVGTSLIFRLTVTDDQGRIVDKDFVIYIQSAPADISIAIPANAPSEIKDIEQADFNITVVSENDIKYIKTFIDQTEITALTKEAFNNPKEDDYSFNYKPTVADADKTLSFTIEVMDVLGNIVKQPYSLNVKRSQAVDFDVYTGVKLGAQRATDEGPFFNASNGEVYVTTGAASKSANIDLATFYSGSSNAYNIVSPTLPSVAQFIYTVAGYADDAIENWTTKNQTLIKKITLSQSEFDLIASSAEIEALYINSAVAASETSGGLTTNSVMVFKTAADKYGVLFVKDKSANANTGHLTTDIKIQK